MLSSYSDTMSLRRSFGSEHIKKVRLNHRVAIGAVLRGDRALQWNQADALVRRGYATREGGVLKIIPEIEDAYRAEYRLASRRLVVPPPPPPTPTPPPPRPRVIVHRIV
jgi:hypothetical protein